MVEEALPCPNRESWTSPSLLKVIFSPVASLFQVPAMLPGESALAIVLQDAKLAKHSQMDFNLRLSIPPIPVNVGIAGYSLRTAQCSYRVLKSTVQPQWSGRFAEWLELVEEQEHLIRMRLPDSGGLFDAIGDDFVAGCGRRPSWNL